MTISDFVDVDLTSLTTYDDGPPHAAFDTLRSLAPVVWHPEQPIDPKFVPLGGGVRSDEGFWAVTSHEAVSYASRHPGDFSAWLGGVSLFSFDEAGLAATRQMMINMDPPEHSRLRRLVQPMFSPRALELLRGLVVDQSRELVASLARSGEADFVSTVASELPVRVLAALLGVPMEESHRLLAWTKVLMSAEDPTTVQPEALMTAATEMAEYGSAIIEDRRSRPRDDLVSLIANGEIEGERLSDGELAAFWNLIVIAGNETTRNGISGGLLALVQHGLWTRLRAHPELAPTAVEEILRFVTPVMHFRRTATRNVELGGQSIGAGDKVVMFYTAANRDPSVFDVPHEFRPDRTPNPHLSFGVGAHVCIGAQLARMELVTLLVEMLQRFATVDIVSPPVRVRSNFINMIKQLEVAVTVA